MYLGESRRSFVNTFLNFGKDKEPKLGTDWRAFHKMGDLFENDKIPERDEGLNGCRDMSFPRVERWRVFDVDTLTAFVDQSQRRSTRPGVPGVLWVWSSEGPYVHTLCKVSVVLHSFLPGELSFQWSMKRSIQATLTGEAFKAKPVCGESSVGSGNQTLYCEFVDAFCRVSPRACVRCRYQRGAGRVEECALESRWREAAHRRAKRDGAEGEVRVWMEGYHLCQSPAIFVIRQIGVWPTRIVLIVRIGVLDIWRECHRVGPFVCQVLFPRGSSFCQDHIMWTEPLFLGQQKIFFMGAYMHLVYVFVWRGGGGGGSTQTNIVRLKQNVDNWRRPLRSFKQNCASSRFHRAREIEFNSLRQARTDQKHNFWQRWISFFLHQSVL